MYVHTILSILFSLFLFKKVVVKTANAKAGEARAADVMDTNTYEFLGAWEQLYNSDFKHFKMQAGLPTFVFT